MSDASNYAEGEIADWLGGNGQPSAVVNVYLKLHTGAPGDDGTSNAAANTTRKEATFAAQVGGVISLDGTLPKWLAVPSAETYSHVSGWDHLTAGNCLFSATMSVPVVVAAANDFELISLTVAVL